MLGELLAKQDTIIWADMDRNIPKPQFSDYTQHFIIMLGNRAIGELQVQKVEYGIECSIVDPVVRLDMEQLHGECKP
jgi:hypothetical protein